MPVGRKINTSADRVRSQFDINELGVIKQRALHADALGSFRALTTATDGVVDSNEAYDYTAFGSLLSGDRSSTSHAFTGQLADPYTSYQYHRAR